MAIIAVNLADNGDSETLWAVPPNAQLDKSPIPRGIRHYHGTAPIAILGSGDQTAVTLSFTFPTRAVYLPRVITLKFASDDTTSEFDQFGTLRFTQNSGTIHSYVMRSEGISRQGATLLAENIYRPLGRWREWINVGEDPVTGVQMSINDNSGDASAAGDVEWAADFWIYDIEQCNHYTVNLFEQFLPY